MMVRRRSLRNGNGNGNNNKNNRRFDKSSILVHNTNLIHVLRSCSRSCLCLLMMCLCLQCRHDCRRDRRDRRGRSSTTH